ncbi:MAG: GAF domain-containing protein [Planctomycetota bacterium]
MENAEELAYRLKRLELIHRISRELNNTTDAAALFPRVLTSALEAVGAEAGSLWLLQGENIVCDQAIGGAGEDIIGMELPRGAGVVGSVAQRKKPEIVLDVEKDARHLHQVDDATGFKALSMITVPMLVKGESLGALQVINKKGEGAKFTKWDAMLVQEIAIDAAAAVKNAMLLKTEQRVRELRALLKLSREITSTLDIDHILVTAANVLSGIIKFDRCVVALKREGSLVPVAISGKEEVDLEDPDLVPLKSLLGWVGGFDKSVWSPWPDALEDEDPKSAERFKTHAESSGNKAVLTVPLNDESGSLGIIVMESATEEFLAEHQQELVEIFANQVAIALRNADLYSQTPALGFLARRGSGDGLGAVGSKSLWSRPGVRIAAVAAGLLLVLSIWPTDRVASGVSDVEEGEQVKRGQLLGALRENELNIQKREIDAQVRATRADVARASKSGNAGESQSAKEQLRYLEARSDDVQRQLDACRLVSPVDGFLLTHRPRDLVGTVTSPGQTVLQVAESGKWVVEVLVPQDEIPGAEPGQEATFRSPAVPGKAFEGKVVSVGVTAIAEDDGTTFPVTIEIEDPDAQLRSGMQGTGKVVVGRHSMARRLFGGIINWLRWTTGI